MLYVQADSQFWEAASPRDSCHTEFPTRALDPIALQLSGTGIA
jgi:hypothetical protein